ncbi:hypothetical protein H6P81_015907 [Aristolochia fimbriata]|uniref:Uncharacterized protein n=1 Tax=Aristolochia fimbriata TaxID=158543 RepID=A0AAV7EAL8_ARIFI|nr:hypothetical protein H6P81_015907 [Aristolochia fimbriata]
MTLSPPHLTAPWRIPPQLHSLPHPPQRHRPHVSGPLPKGERVGSLLPSPAANREPNIHREAHQDRVKHEVYADEICPDFGLWMQIPLQEVSRSIVCAQGPLRTIVAEVCSDVFLRDLVVQMRHFRVLVSEVIVLIDCAPIKA